MLHNMSPGITIMMMRISDDENRQTQQPLNRRNSCRHVIIKRRNSIYYNSFLVITLSVLLLLYTLSVFPIVSSFVLPKHNKLVTAATRASFLIITRRASSQQEPIFYNDFGDDYSNDSGSSTSNSRNGSFNDDNVLTISTTEADWRTVRRNLSSQQSEAKLSRSSSSSSNNNNNNKKKSSVANNKQNEELLQTQNEQLYNEYKTDVWAHEIPTPEIGGLVVRLPLEVELYKNYKHSRMGKKLRKKLESRVDIENNKLIKRKSSDNNDILTVDTLDVGIWYSIAQKFIEDEMMKIAEKAAEEGDIGIDITTLNDEASELLQLFLHHQETWQEVCLVLDTKTTLVLNRPMAFKLTDTIAQLVLYGSRRKGEYNNSYNNSINVKDFIQAFGNECGIYIGGPDLQYESAILIHGIRNIPDAVEFAPGLYHGGNLQFIIDGVLSGKYKPLEFRFFIGRHVYNNNNYNNNKSKKSLSLSSVSSSSSIEIDVVLGKLQPIACARSIILKQCIQLPKPLWHEVLELCSKSNNNDDSIILSDISDMELLKRDDIRFQLIDDDDDDDDANDDDDDDDEYDVVIIDDDDDEIIINDELDELFDDDNDDDNNNNNGYYRI